MGASALPSAAGYRCVRAELEAAAVRRPQLSGCRSCSYRMAEVRGPFVDLRIGSKAEQAELASYLRSVASVPKSPPKAVLVISAHWEEPLPTVMTSANPPLLYDYYGFPQSRTRSTGQHQENRR